MNFELLRTFQLAAEHTKSLTQALAPVLAKWGTHITHFHPRQYGASLESEKPLVYSHCWRSSILQISF